MELGGKSIIERACSGGEELFYKKEFDLVGMVVTLHGIRPDTRFNILENAYRALKSEKRWAALDSWLSTISKQIEGSKKPHV